MKRTIAMILTITMLVSCLTAINVSAACSHGNYEDYYSGTDRTGNYDSINHELLTNFNRFCGYCGEFVEKVGVIEYEAHSIRNGSCRYCGYEEESEDFEDDYDVTIEKTAITSYSVEVDKNSRNVRIIAEGDNRVKKLVVTLSGNSYSDMKTKRSSKINTKLVLPTSDDYLTYDIRIYAYDSLDNVIGHVNTNCFAKRNNTVWQTICEGTKNGLAMLGGVAVGIVNGGVVQPIMAVSNMLDYVINLGNKEQYEYNKAWRASLTSKLEDFMIDALPYDQYYYYNAGIAGGEISEFCVGTVVVVRGIAGAITKVETVDDDIQLAEVVLDNGDEAVVFASKSADDVVVLTAANLDDMADVGSIAYNFKSQKELLKHFEKHATELEKVFGYSSYSIEQYAADADYVVKSGIYVKEKNAFVKFIAGDKYAFVGLDSELNITTFHIKTVEWLKKFAPSLGIE